MTNANRTKRSTPTDRKVKYHLRVPAQGIDVPVYAGETEDEALERASSEHPALRARAQRLRAHRAAGREEGVSLNELLEREGMPTEPQPAASRRRTHPGPIADAANASGKLQLRLPQSLHRDVVQRAESEGVSVNQLLVAYISRGIGQDEGASSSTRG